MTPYFFSWLCPGGWDGRLLAGAFVGGRIFSLFLWLVAYQWWGSRDCVMTIQISKRIDRIVQNGLPNLLWSAVNVVIVFDRRVGGQIVEGIG